MRSPRVDAFAAALISQRLAGGDLAGLLRRFAEGAAERDRVAEDAKSATAQARFTGLLVVAMPDRRRSFAELIQPGFLAKLLGAPASAVLLALAAALQIAGFFAISPTLKGERVSPPSLLAAIAVLLGSPLPRAVCVSLRARVVDFPWHSRSLSRDGPSPRPSRSACPLWAGGALTSAGGADGEGRGNCGRG